MSEDITGNVSIISAHVTEDIHTGSINGIEISDIEDYLNMDKMNSINKDVEIVGKVKLIEISLSPLVLEIAIVLIDITSYWSLLVCNHSYL
ncbi:MAG: hypothetical protein ACTS8P_01835 [Arsenophonus sp. NC-XBC3-MAG3]